MPNIPELSPPHKGKDIEKYVSVTDLYIPLDYGEKLTKEELIKRYLQECIINGAMPFQVILRFFIASISFSLYYF